MKGTISLIRKREVKTRKGQTSVWDITVDGKTYSTFKDCKDYNADDLVEFEYEQVGQYLNITSISKPKKEVIQHNNRDIQIIRQNVLNMAVELYIASGRNGEIDLKPDDSLAKIKYLAEELEKWVLR